MLAIASFNTNNSDPWEMLPVILKQIKAPVFPEKDFPVTGFGAVGDGVTDCTEAFKKAIEACNQAGGGRVVVPEGQFYCGPIYLKSNVNLHVVKKATILFSTNPNNYLPLVHTRWEGVELMNYAPLIYAYKEKNIAITGDGILDGQASTINWWAWKAEKANGWNEGMPNQKDINNRSALFAMAEEDVPVEERRFGNGFYLRPQFVQPYECKNILIEGVKFVDSPMWILTPVLCNNVTIHKVTVESDGPNNDGCDPESCKNVLIKDCYFNTGDDCIAIKSGRNRDGRRINIPSENIIIQGCTMVNGHGAVVIGSEISGGVKNVFAEDCIMNSPKLYRVLRIKTSSARGGVTENIFLRNITVGQVKHQVIMATMHYEDAGSYMPAIRNIQVRDMHVENGGAVGILLEGYPESAIENLHLKNVTINNVKTPYKVSDAANISFDNVVINGDRVVL